MPNETQSYDIVVLGGGTGGYGAAFRAGQLGLKVALVDDNPKGLGGTCLHIGCIPTKAMLASADLFDHMKHSSEFGIEASGLSADPVVIAARRDKIVARLVKGVTSLTKKNDVDYILGRGKLEGPQQVRVKTTDTSGASTGEVILRAKDVVLASGSRVKSLPGLEPEAIDKSFRSSEVVLGTVAPQGIERRVAGLLLQDELPINEIHACVYFQAYPYLQATPAIDHIARFDLEQSAPLFLPALR